MLSWRRQWTPDACSLRRSWTSIEGVSRKWGCHSHDGDSVGPCEKQQMRWSPGGAHYLLQVRAEVLNGALLDRYREWRCALRALTFHKGAVLQQWRRF